MAAKKTKNKATKKTKAQTRKKTIPLLSLKELAFELGIHDRTIYRFVKRGCPVRRMKASKGKGGPTRLKFSIQKVLDWCVSEGIECKRDPGAVVATQKTVKSAPPATGQKPTLDPDIPKSGIVGAMARLRSMERVAYSIFLRSMKANEPPSMISAKEAIYLKAHEALRRTETAMPKILEGRGESIPLETAIQEAAKIDLAIKNQFLTLPRKLATTLAANSDAGEIEEILQGEIDDCLRHLASGGIIQEETPADVSAAGTPNGS